MDATCCKYTSTSHLRSRPSDSAQTDSSSTSSVSKSPLPRSLSVTPVGVSSSNLVELRLMHHYTKSVFSRPSRISGAALYHSLWDFEIPQVAFSSELVLNALLGLTSLNLLSLHPDDQALSSSAWSYFNKAVILQRTALDTMERRNAEPMIIAAVLLAHYNWLASCSEDNPHPKKLEVETYNMCKGILNLAQESGPCLEKYSSIPEVVVEVPAESSLDQNFIDLAAEDMGTLLESLEYRNIHQEGKDACHKFADEVMNIYTLIASGCKDNAGLEQKMVTVLHRVPECFVQLLDVGDPIALALLARSIICLDLLDDSSAWWVHGAGSCKVPPKAINGILKTMPIEYRWTMDFPLRVVAKEVKINHDFGRN